MLTILGGTDAGLVRKNNQDKYEYKVLGELLCYGVLCDGMGGTDCGQLASQTATDFVAQALERDLRPGMSEASLKGVMMSAAAGANALVFDTAAQNPGCAGMGTTLVVAVVSGESVYISSVGDSRAYHFGSQGQKQLTKDHTVVQMLLDVGEISQEEAAEHPKRHLITRAVGVMPQVEADFVEHPFLPGDVLLLCSDGLYNYAGSENMDAPALLTHLEKSVGAGSVDNLIELAKNIGGGGDNITAVLICREPAQPEEGA
ncbi:MAG: protein phosphatase 2C domain-containing protein [Oscillospiraceae bacterium]|nr:protein phosphatase 2C domain-containing protein [Oscillospiraceae bacterium]